jgi:DNA-binding PadR family transcriptional regulator
MSPVFRHGRLRLYLLKLLDDAPKHGYEVIRLLQDRFMGVYAPSPGTIYPRLARLEEEGLVTHDEIDGRKVYRLTEKGREEIRAREDDLAELEQEITDSVRDIAREVKEDVRETVRNLREEIARAAKDVHRDGGRPGETHDRAHDEAWRTSEEASDRARWAREETRRARAEARGATQQEAGEARQEAGEARQERGEARQERGEARQERGEPRREREDAGPWEHGAHRPHEEYERASEDAGARFRSGRGRARKDWGDWSAFRDWPGWQEWPGWKERPGWRERPGGHDWPGHGRTPGWPDAARFRDLERLALQFAGELRRLASHASAVGEDALVDLRVILDEALGKIRTEIFEPERKQDDNGSQQDSTSQDGQPEDSTSQDPAPQQEDSGSQPEDSTGHDPG